MGQLRRVKLFFSFDLNFMSVHLAPCARFSTRHFILDRFYITNNIMIEGPLSKCPHTSNESHAKIEFCVVPNLTRYADVTALDMDLVMTTNSLGQLSRSPNLAESKILVVSLRKCQEKYICETYLLWQLLAIFLEMVKLLAFQLLKTD